MDIEFELSSESIGKAIEDLENYINSLGEKDAQISRRLCEEGLPVIQQKISNVYTDDADLDRSYSTSIKTKSRGAMKESTLEVTGNDITFIEFGAGVSFNGHVGSSPNPKGAELGYTIGDYGKGQGKKLLWRYQDSHGDLVYTRGTKAAMPLYLATVSMKSKVQKIAREIYSRR